MSIFTTIPLMAANEFLLRLIDKVDTTMMDFIWDRGWNGRGDVLWDDMIPLATALGAVFSVILVGKIAFKSMVLEDRLDIMKLWKPLAVVFILANWYAVTWSVFSLAQPLEDFFRGAFESQNTAIVSLQNQRLAALQGVNKRNLEHAALSKVGEEFEKDALTRDDRQNYVEDKGEQLEEDNDILISTYGELYYDMRDVPDRGDGEPLPKFDASLETGVVKTQNFIEQVMLWLCETFWLCAVMLLFLARAFFMCILVMFGPVYIAASVLPAWEYAWKEWLERYIWVNMLGPVSYLALTFALIILQFGVKVDVQTYSEIASQDAAWYEWVAHCIRSFAGSVGMYVVALFTGIAATSVVFELASMVFPSQGIHGVAMFFQAMYQQGKNTAMSAGHTAYRQTSDQVDKARGRHQVSSIYDDAEKTKASLHLDDEMGPEGTIRDGRSTGEIKGHSNSYDDHIRSSGDSGMNAGTAAAHRWADRMWRDKMDRNSRSRRKDNWQTSRLRDAEQDLEQYLKAVGEGRGDEFIRHITERAQDNRILLEIERTGHVSIHLFGGDEIKRDNFLRRHGLYEAFHKAQKFNEKAEKMRTGHNRRSGMVKNARQQAAQDLELLITEKVRDILAARGLHTGVGFVPADADTQAGADGSTRTSRHETGTDVGRGVGTYRLQQGDDGYDNVQQQMRRSWFRKLSADSYNRKLLLLTLQAYEKALDQGRGEEFLRSMRQFRSNEELFDEINAMDGTDYETTYRANPFGKANVSDTEFRSIWDDLSDTETLRRVNQALDDIERAQTDTGDDADGVDDTEEND